MGQLWHGGCSSRPERGKLPNAYIMISEAERARQIAQTIQAGLSGSPAGNFTVTSRGGCASCDPGACPECGYLFTGDIVTIQHVLRGKRTITEKAIHYLSHGITHYETGYVIQGERVVVDLNVDEIASYLDL